MNRLIALCSFVLSLYGCDVGGQEAVQRTTVDGRDTLHSRVLARPGVARFECLRSASGACHYVVLPAAADARRFTLREGETRPLQGLHAFGVCVSTQADGPSAGCERQDLLAVW